TPSWPEAWPGWAPVAELPAPVEHGVLDAEGPPAPPEDPLAAAVQELTACLEEARGQRAATETARQEAEAAAHGAHREVVRLAAASDGSETGEDIERLRARLRAQLHKPPPLSKVEEGVDQLRESRLARDNEGRRRRK